MITLYGTQPRRSLAAIMFVDMVGYSALMQGDETRAHEAHTRYRKVLDAATDRYDGEVVQHYGDGALVLFRSVVRASRAAVEIQRALRLGPAVPVRIGLHLADVVRNVDGVYGNGVNVAARIEALAVPGSVLISERVAKELHNQPEVETTALGSVRLKNIDEPMRVHALVDGAVVVPEAGDLGITCTPGCAEQPAAPLPSPSLSGLPLLMYELHRRRVWGVAVGYLVTAVAALTLLLQVESSMGLPWWMVRVGIAAAMLGLPVSVGLAWEFDVTPCGILRTEPSLPGRSRWALGVAGTMATVLVATLA